MKLGHTIEDSRAKYPELTDDILNELRAWSEERGVPGIPDVQLGIFAHSCYYDVEATKSCMSVYYRLRSTTPEFFGNRDVRIDSIQQSFKAFEMLVLPELDNYGNRIIFSRLLDYRPSMYSLDNALKLLLMTIDASLYYEGCIPGYICLFDMKGVSLGHLTKLSLGSLRKFFEYLQEGLPVRLKAIHVLNCAWITNKLLAIVRPFMKRELFEMLHLYAGEVSEIHEHIEPKRLPKDYGGELEYTATLSEEHCAKLDQLRDYFREEESLFRGWPRKDSGKRSPTLSRGSETDEDKVNGTLKGQT